MPANISMFFKRKVGFLFLVKIQAVTQSLGVVNYRSLKVEISTSLRIKVSTSRVCYKSSFQARACAHLIISDKGYDLRTHKTKTPNKHILILSLGNRRKTMH